MSNSNNKITYFSRQVPENIGSKLTHKKIIYELKIPMGYSFFDSKKNIETLTSFIDLYEESGRNAADLANKLLCHGMDVVYNFVLFLRENIDKENYFQLMRPAFRAFILQFDMYQEDWAGEVIDMFGKLLPLVIDKFDIAIVNRIIEAAARLIAAREFNFNNIYEFRKKNSVQYIFDNLIAPMIKNSSVLIEPEFIQYISEDSGQLLLTQLLKSTNRKNEDRELKCRLIASFWATFIKKNLEKTTYNIFSDGNKLSIDKLLIYRPSVISNDLIFSGKHIFPQEEGNLFKADVDRVILPNIQEFREKFEKETDGLFADGKNGQHFPWGKNVVVGGGLVERLLNAAKGATIPEQSDIDIFICEESKKIEAVYISVLEWVVNFCGDSKYIIVKGAVTCIYSKNLKRKVQIVVRQNIDPAGVIAEFDISAIKVLYNGKDVVATWDALLAWRQRLAVINYKYTSLYRCIKIMDRGYDIFKFTINPFGSMKDGKNRNMEKWDELYKSLENVCAGKKREVIDEYYKRLFGSTVNITNNNNENMAKIKIAEGIDGESCAIFTKVNSTLLKRVTYSDMFRNSYGSTNILNFNINSFLPLKNAAGSKLISYGSGSNIYANHLRGIKIVNDLKDLDVFYSSKNNLEANNFKFQYNNSLNFIIIVDLSKSGANYNKNSSVVEGKSEVDAADPSSYMNFINDVTTDEVILRSVPRDRRFIYYQGYMYLFSSDYNVQILIFKPKEQSVDNNMTLGNISIVKREYITIEFFREIIFYAGMCGKEDAISASLSFTILNSECIKGESKLILKTINPKFFIDEADINIIKAKRDEIISKDAPVVSKTKNTKSPHVSKYGSFRLKNSKEPSVTYGERYWTSITNQSRYENNNNNNNTSKTDTSDSDDSDFDDYDE